MNKDVQKNQTSGELGMKDGKPYPPPMDVMCEDKPPDQSPTTTCEWTEGRVFAYFGSEDFKGLADAIKSALAAEREKGFSEAAKIYKPARDDDRREIHQLRTQLADTWNVLREFDHTGGNESLSECAGVAVESYNNLKHQLAAAQEYNAKCHARMSERKSVHQWLTAQNIPEEENGKRICLLRRLRITLDRLAETENEVEGLKEANRGLYIESNQRFQQLAAAQAFVGQAKNAMTGTGSWKLGDTPTTALDAAIATATKPLVDALILAKQSCPLASTHDVIDAALAKVKEGKCK